MYAISSLQNTEATTMLLVLQNFPMALEGKLQIFSSVIVSSRKDWKAEKGSYDSDFLHTRSKVGVGG